MRAAAIASEAWRNLATGTSRAGLLALGFVLTIGTLAAVDVRAVVAVLQEAAEFRAAGATVQVLESEAGIDGARCAALTGTGGVTAAGAVRRGADVRALNLPSATVSVLEVTPAFLDVLPGAGTAAPATPGIWLAADLADALGAGAGDEIATSAGPATIAAVYAFPDDGRDRTLGYAALAPVPAVGAFDACWAEIWPPDEAASALVRSALVPTAAGQPEVTQAQLNPRLGRDHDAVAALADRLTGPAPGAATVAGLLLGLGAARARRLELASALHARVPKPALAFQVLGEAVAWVGAATLVTTAVLGWLASWQNPDPGLATWAIGLRTTGAGAAAVLLGVVLGVLTTRERHLFRYFKDR